MASGAARAHGVRLDHDYPATPARVWALVTDWDAHARASARHVALRGLPRGRMRGGQRVEAHASLFGVLPERPHRIDVLECDDEAMRLLIEERDAGGRRWRHAARVIALPNGGGRLIESIEVDAGALSPLVALWVRRLARGRHAPRLALLEAGAF